MDSLKLTVQRPSTKSAFIKWAPCKDVRIDTYHVTLKDLSVLQGEYMFYVGGDKSQLKIPFELVPGHQYSVCVRASMMDTSHNHVVYKTIRIATTKFKAVFTTAELQTLHKKAVDFIHRKKDHPKPIQWLYRNKPQEYFEHVWRNDGIMEKYMKDNNGDLASTINGRLHGLFFGCNVENNTGYPPRFSHFGPVRFYMPVSIISGDEVNFYFADFYCNNQAHYVTIVVAVNGSGPDQFCQKNLLKLDPHNNNFLVKRITLSPNPMIPPLFEMFSTTNVWLEIFYTENIDIPHFTENYGCYFDHVEAKGQSRAGGISKNPNCSDCNL